MEQQYPGKFNVAIIAARANELIVSRLVEGAMRACTSFGIKEAQISVVRVAGALESP